MFDFYKKVCFSKVKQLRVGMFSKCFIKPFSWCFFFSLSNYVSMYNSWCYCKGKTSK